MIEQRSIELLAPAKNLECGIEAVNHGADAVYIGASRFGARASAGNSVEDIARLVEYAHRFRVRVYVTINTILRDEELDETEKLIWSLYRVGVDALIVQDMALLKLSLPPIPLHASTQMDNRTPAKVKWLAGLGFEQVVLARELSLQEIEDIHRTTSVPLEAFVHGALCVSYSGQCYASQYCFGRSANRGECAQFCRLKFDLVDSDGKVIEHDKYLLSLKDMNRSEDLERMLAAGVSSFKIEGRLKDVSYVKNVTAYYRKRLDEIIARNPLYRRASSGRVRIDFEPNLSKSFNRGFTRYYIDGHRTPDVFSFHTPKALGERVGTVKEVRRGCIVVSSISQFHNGDGLCFYDEQGRLQGFRVNRAEANKLFPMEMPQVAPRTVLYRNYDQEFEKILSRASAERKLMVKWTLADVQDGFTLTLTDEDEVQVTVRFDYPHELARSPQTDNLRTQLAKLGNTHLECEEVEIRMSANWFIPSSVLSGWRRTAVVRLEAAQRMNYPQHHRAIPTEFTQKIYGKVTSLPEGTPLQLTYLANVMNNKSEEFYRDLGALNVLPAYEKCPPKNAVLMFCKHCIRYSMGWCPRVSHERTPYKEPYYLVSADGRRFRLDFDCRNCQMKVVAEENSAN